jgi:hypothetical protein
MLWMFTPDPNVVLTPPLCTMRCSGDRDGMSVCGGPQAMSVYMTTDWDLERKPRLQSVLVIDFILQIIMNVQTFY